MDPVQIEQFFLGCLAHASYLVASEGVAAVIDPQRDVDLYLETAQRNGWTIRHIIETHLHADFVSGHRELADRTGAQIYLGAGSGATFPHVAVHDGDEIRFGQCQLQFLQTPGHTLESVCVLLTDSSLSGAPRAVFTGDTLFVGDVGRPDLSPHHTPQQLAAMLYESLRTKLLPLPDSVEIFPAHGAGSLCGRQMGTERSSTLGKERRYNYALQAANVDEFVRLLTDNLPPRPEYFQSDVELNRQGAAPLDRLPPLPALTPAEVLRLQADGALVLDTRPAIQFAVAHIPRSMHIGLTGQYASWAARLLGVHARIILVAETPKQVGEARMRLARVGIESPCGFADGGIIGWIQAGQPVEYIPHLSVQEAAEFLEAEGSRVQVLDVREPGECSQGTLAGATRIPLSQLASRTAELDRGKTLLVYCKGGYRSSIATSILRRAGFEDLVNLTGGYDAWTAAQLPAAVPA
jgi:glyoxylase-like metal-dependent hydrolase (beta-lactamase superfamily II)/rhodanese-related sulfurtransferase